jgi:hypothetical protein
LLRRKSSLAERRDLAGQEAAAERRPGDQRDAELAQRREQILLGLAAPERVLVLHRGDRVHLVRAPNFLGRDVAQAQVAHVSLPHGLGHRAHRHLDRRRGIDVVRVPQVDHVDVEALEAGRERLACVGRRPVDLQREAPVRRQVAPALARIEDDAELGRHEGPLAPPADRAADELLVVPVPVRVGRVDHG